jgi:hypothetical protein
MPSSVESCSHPQAPTTEEWWADVLERREAERERLRKEREAREQQRQASNKWENWWAAIDQRIDERVLHLFGEDGPLMHAIAEAMAIWRTEDRKEVKRLIEEERHSFEAKLAEEQRKWQFMKKVEAFGLPFTAFLKRSTSIGAIWLIARISHSGRFRRITGRAISSLYTACPRCSKRSHGMPRGEAGGRHFANSAESRGQPSRLRKRVLA